MAAACRCARRLIRGCSSIARKALVDGLVKFDRSKGWRGPVKQIDVAGDWGATLADIDVPSDIAPWRLGVTLSVEAKKIVVGLRPQKLANGKVAPAREAVEITLAEMKWAGPFQAYGQSKGAGSEASR